MNKLIIFFFGLVGFPLFVNARLCGYYDIQCGNICGNPVERWYCFCGNETIYRDQLEQCCSNSDCETVYEPYKKKVCLQGEVIYRHEKCNGQCTQREGMVSPTCPNISTCKEFASGHMCHGLRLRCDNGNEEEICKNPESFQCDFSQFWQTCGHILGAKYSQNECFKKDPRFFSCLNRMDQASEIFNTTLFNKEDKEDKVDILKNTNETGLNCGEGFFFSWHDSKILGGYLYQSKINHLMDDVPCRKHIGMIKRDFSFKYKNKVNWNLTSWQEAMHYQRNPDWFYQNHCVENSLNCTNYTNICYSKNEVCDQICQCPDCEDESFDKCKDLFPATATEKCIKAGTNNNTSLWIKATPCNKVIECKDESDETNCKSDYSVYIILGVSALIILICAWMKIGHISRYWKKVVSHVRGGIHQELIEGAHGQQSLISFVVSHQGTNLRTDTNQQFFKWELAHHGNDKAETFACIKDQFDPNTCKNVLEDAPLPKSCWSKTMDMVTSW